MKKLTYILSAVVLVLALWAAVLWLPSARYDKGVTAETRYGINEGMQLVEQTMLHGERQYVVEDGRGNVLFRILNDSWMGTLRSKMCRVCIYNKGCETIYDRVCAGRNPWCNSGSWYHLGNCRYL